MIIRVLLIAASLALAAPCHAQEGGLQQRLEALKGFEVKSAAAPTVTGMGRMARDFAMLQSNTAQLEGQLANQDFENARRFIRNWLQNASSPQIRTMLEGLLAEVEKLAKQRDDQLRDKARSLLDKAGAACLAAKKEEELAPVVEEMRDFMETELSSGRSRRTGRFQSEFNNAIQFLDRWQEYLAARASGSPEAALQILQQLVGYPTRIVPRAKVLALQKELTPKLLGGMKEQLDRIIAQLAAAKNATQATTAADSLNDLYDDLNRLGVNIPSVLRQRFEMARQSAQEWRMVHLFEEQNRPMLALERLRNLDRNNYADTYILPPKLVAEKRVALIQKVADMGGDGSAAILAAVDQIVTSIKTGEDIPPARVKIERLQRVAGADGDLIGQSLHRLAAELTALESLHRQVLGIESAGNVCRMAFPPEGHPWQKQLAPFREALMLQATAARFNLPELVRAKGNGLAGKIEGLADEAAAKGDWMKAMGCLNALRAVARPVVESKGGVDSEIAGIAALIAGQNLEKAGQFATAIESYREVLRQVGKRVPVQEAAERLTAIAKAHPETLEKTESSSTRLDLEKAAKRLGILEGLSKQKTPSSSTPAAP